MAQQLKALTVLAEDISSVPSTRVVAHNHLNLHFQAIMFSLASLVSCTHTVHINLYNLVCMHAHMCTHTHKFLI